MMNNVTYTRGVLSGGLRQAPLNVIHEIPSAAKGRRRFFLLHKKVYEDKLIVDAPLPPSNTNFSHCYVRQHDVVVGSFFDVVGNHCAYSGLSLGYVLPESRGSSDFTSPLEEQSGGVLLFCNEEGSYMVTPSDPPASPLLVTDKS